MGPLIWLRVGACIAAFVVAAVALMPLRLTWAMAGTPADLSVAAIDGTVWGGKISGVSWRGWSLGDFDVAIAPLDGAFPTLRLSNGTGPLKFGIVSASGDAATLSEGEVQISLSAQHPGRVAELGVRASGATVMLKGNTCQTAAGRLQIAESRELGSPAFTGDLACLQGRLTARLSSVQGEAILEVLGPDFSTIAYRSASPTLVILFTAAGIPSADALAGPSASSGRAKAER